MKTYYLSEQIKKCTNALLFMLNKKKQEFPEEDLALFQESYNGLLYISKATHPMGDFTMKLWTFTKDDLKSKNQTRLRIEQLTYKLSASAIGTTKESKLLVYLSDEDWKRNAKEMINLLDNWDNFVSRVVKEKVYDDFVLSGPKLPFFDYKNFEKIFKDLHITEKEQMKLFLKGYYFNQFEDMEDLKLSELLYEIDSDNDITKLSELLRNCRLTNKKYSKIYTLYGLPENNIIPLN